MTDNKEETETPAAATTEADGEIYDWSAFYDSDGKIYYCNAKTEESSWDPPEQFNPPPEPEADVPAAAAAAAANGAEEETKVEAAVAPEAEATTKWSAFTDDEGRTYYCNNHSEETQWDKPDDFDGEETTEEAPAEDSAVEAAATAVEEPDVPSEESEKPEPMEVDEEPPVDAVMQDAPEEPEEEAIDPAIKRAQDAVKALEMPDSVLEPGCIENVTEVVNSEGGNPQKAVEMLLESYVGESAECGLLGRWLAGLISAPSKDSTGASAPSEAVADGIRATIQEVVNRVAKEKFSKEAGDSILDLSKSEAAFLESMMDSSRWRKLLIDLYASHKDSAVLIYCLGAISKRGHHREIAKRVNQSDHFVVFDAMLLSELTVIGKMAVSAGGDSSISIGLEELISDLGRTCTSTSFTYLYSLEVLRYLQSKARQEMNGEVSDRFNRAIRKWELLEQHLETSMMDPSASSSVSGSFNKRVEVALTLSELQQRQKRRKQDGDSSGNGETESSKLEKALMTCLRSHSKGHQMGATILDPLLPAGGFSGAGDVGGLLMRHPLAIKAFLGQLYKPGSTRVTSSVVQNKLARLIALGVMAAEKEAMTENGREDSTMASDEVALTGMILDGSAHCENLETMVSFLVLTGSDEAGPSASPSQKLCALAFKCAPVAQGTILWAREFASGPEFAASASFPTLSTSMLALVRVVCLRQPFTRGAGVDIALAFLRHANPDITVQKLIDIKEQTLRLLLHLLVKGEVTSVLGKIAGGLEQQGRSPILDASLVRYFVSGILEVIRPPVSIVFVRSFAGLLKAPKCVDAVRTQYFGEPHRQRLVDLLKSFQSIRSSGGGELAAEDALLVSSLLTIYQIA